MLTGCQEKKGSTIENSTSSVTASKDTTEPKSSDKSSLSKKNNDKSSSKTEIEEISAEEYEKRVNNKDAAGQIIFFKTPGSKESDEALKKFSKQCQEIGEKLYTLDVTTEAGKKIIKKYSLIKTPYDVVLLTEGGKPMYWDLPNAQEPISVVKDVVTTARKNS
ncbi:hypothetical protein XA3_15880 [Xylocopilactobacillus apicola]|uniref:Thioredoxin domain-containing protein n=2 Tax=Xylocopilactobacillus apicola TaxID=2932184 RepID=A0AAU9DE60_9LACO|nr:hypothetical protein XA3_15880 [Xylocopilactobacillus apicola]